MLMPADEFDGHISDIRCISGLSPLPLAVPSASKNHAGMLLILKLWMMHGGHTPLMDFPKHLLAFL
jgi:hypothetical protein